MQNKDSNLISDHDFALQLLHDEYNGDIIHEGNYDAQLKKACEHSTSLGIEKNDYETALILQEMYDKKRDIVGNDYEDIVPRMNNMSFENNEEKKHTNKPQNLSEGLGMPQKGTNHTDDDGAPPPYGFPHRPRYSGGFPQSDTTQRSPYNNNGDEYGHNNNNNGFPPRPTYNDGYDEYINNRYRNNYPYNNNNGFHPRPTYNDNYDDYFNNRYHNNYPHNNSGFPPKSTYNYGNSNYYRDNNYDDNSYHSYRKPTRNIINLPGQEPRVFKILILGGTGTGKSTIINTMTNYFLDGTLEDIKIAIPSRYHKVTEKDFANRHSEAKFDDVTKSQTTKCHEYNFNHPSNPAYKFVFIDTPGLSDTSGVKQDDKNIQEIVNTAISAGTLSAIVIIANGTEARVTPSIKNTLVRLANNLPDELIDHNLLLILTKCAKSSACFSEDAFAKEIAKPKQIFYMDNQAFSTDPQVWINDEEERHTVQLHWERSIRTIDKLLIEITGLSSTSTQAFETMKTLRNKIKSEIAIVTQDIANIQQVQDSLDAAQKALQSSGNKMNSFSNYTTTTSLKIKKIVKASYHSTVCTLHLKENIICHDHCGLEFQGNSGTNHFGYCYCMGPNKLCNVCGCGPLSHFHDKVKLDEQTQTISKILEDIKAQYDNANQQYQKYSSDINGYQSSISTLQAAADAKYKHIHKLCLDLSKICSRFNFVDELHANIESMKQDARTIQNTNLRKNAEMEIQRLEKLANDLSSKGANFNESCGSNEPCNSVQSRLKSFFSFLL